MAVTGQMLKRLSIWGAAATVVVAGTGIASATPSGPSVVASPSDANSIPDKSDDEIHLCFNNGDAKNDAGGAALSIIDKKVNKKDCGGLRHLEINAEGPRGHTGKTGARGLQGIPGSNGTNGTNGTNGAIGPAGPSNVPISGTNLTGLPGPPNGNNPQPNRVFYPEGITGILPPVGFTAAFDLTVSDFELVVSGPPNTLQQGPRTYWLTNGTTSIPCIVAPSSTTCVGANSITVPAGGTFWLSTGSPTLLPASDLPLFSRWSYVLSPVV